MSSPRTSAPAGAEIPAVPLTIEGYSVLHQMMRVRWAAWRELDANQARRIDQDAGREAALGFVFAAEIDDDEMQCERRDREIEPAQPQ